MAHHATAHVRGVDAGPIASSVHREETMAETIMHRAVTQPGAPKAGPQTTHLTAHACGSAGKLQEGMLYEAAPLLLLGARRRHQGRLRWARACRVRTSLSVAVNPSRSISSDWLTTLISESFKCSARAEAGNRGRKGLIGAKAATVVYRGRPIPHSLRNK